MFGLLRIFTTFRLKIMGRGGVFNAQALTAALSGTQIFQEIGQHQEHSQCLLANMMFEVGRICPFLEHTKGIFKLLYPETETSEEQLATVKRMKLRNPKLMFDVCPVCNTWSVVLPQYRGTHPLCWEQPKRKRNTKDKNQGLLI